MPEPQAEGAEAPTSEESAPLDLIYKIEGRPNDVDALELSRVLESFTNIVKESYRVTQGRTADAVVRVKPFEPGSFVMDVVLYVQQHAGLLFPLTQPELINGAKEALSTLGFIKDLTQKGVSLIELLKKLKNGKPEKIEKVGADEYDFHTGDGAVVPVNSKVHALYNNVVINKNTYYVIAPATHESTTDILTFLKNDPENSTVRIGKEDAKAIQAYSQPDSPDTEVYEDTTIRVLHPKAGNYGQTKGTFQFYIAGQKGAIKAKIHDDDFMLWYANGEIRFHRADRLKVKLFEKQIVEGVKTKMEYDILEVLDYVPSQPMQRAG